MSDKLPGQMDDQRWFSLMKKLGESAEASLASSPSIDLSRILDSLGRWPMLRTLSNVKDFKDVVDSSPVYSPELESPASYFEKDEIRVDSFDELNRQIANLISKVGELQLVWRGVQNANWGLHSSLYRRLMEVNGVRGPEIKPALPQSFPTEDQMVRAESNLLAIARDEWRLDGLPALEVFARLQHYGAPTRLIDVTRNPYIAAWFAVETSSEQDVHDGRLFALGTTPVSDSSDGPQEHETRLTLNDIGGGYIPFWHHLSDTAERQQLDWGTGARRRFWVPPAYDPRIVAQNAGFILDGIPIISQQTASSFKRPTSEQKYWNKNDLLASSSIYAKTYSPARKPRASKRKFSPTFTFRISSEAKADIRGILEDRFGYRKSTIYPDVAALAQHVSGLKDIYS